MSGTHQHTGKNDVTVRYELVFLMFHKSINNCGSPVSSVNNSVRYIRMLSKQCHVARKSNNIIYIRINMADYICPKCMIKHARRLWVQWKLRPTIAAEYSAQILHWLREDTLRLQYYVKRKLKTDQTSETLSDPSIYWSHMTSCGVSHVLTHSIFFSFWRRAMVLTFDHCCRKTNLRAYAQADQVLDWSRNSYGCFQKKKKKNPLT